MPKDNGQGQRERRRFTAEFKLEAVRRVAERRAAGVPMTQIARELDVQDDLLRKWQRQTPCGRRASSRIRRAGPSRSGSPTTAWLGARPCSASISSHRRSRSLLDSPAMPRRFWRTHIERRRESRAQNRRRIITPRTSR